MAQNDDISASGQLVPDAFKQLLMTTYNQLDLWAADDR